MIQLKWFRVEHQPDGSISCVEVEAKGKNGGIVRYYEAASAAQACDRAKEWHRKHLEVSRAYKARHVAEQHKAGLCSVPRCQSAPVDGKKMCAPHRDQAVARCRISRLRKAGLIEPYARPSSADQRERHIRKVIEIHRGKGGNSGRYFRVVLKKLDALGPIEFRAWLVSEINKRSDAAHQVPVEQAQAAE